MIGKKIKKSVGILVSNEKIVAIEIEGNGETFKVSNHSTIKLEANIVQGNSIVVETDKFKNALMLLFEKAKNGPIKTKEIIIALSEGHTFAHQIIVPKEKETDIMYVKEKAKDLIPIELDQAVFDYRTIEEDLTEQTVTLEFIATQGNIVESLSKVFDELKIKIKRIDVDLNCLIKSFKNPLDKEKKASLIMYLEEKRDLLTVSFNQKKDYIIVLKKDHEQLIKNVKTSLNLPSVEDAQKSIKKLQSNENLSSEQEVSFEAGIHDYLIKLEEKLNNLLSICKADGASAEIKTVYLMGPWSYLPGIEKIIKKTLGEIEIKRKNDYIEGPTGLNKESLVGLGLCINKMRGVQELDFNLLPESKKNELTVAPIIPKIKRYLLLAMILVIIPVVQLSMTVTKNYILHQVKTQELVILREQSSNPYLTEIAKVKKEKDQFNQLINAVLSDSVPVYAVLAHVDTYNTPGVKLLNLSYQNDSNSHTSNIRMSAEIENREKTEELVENLERSNLFDEVISPLSNLIGKDSRVVRIDLTLDNKRIIDYFNQDQEEIVNESNSNPGENSEVEALTSNKEELTDEQTPTDEPTEP